MVHPDAKGPGKHCLNVCHREFVLLVKQLVYSRVDALLLDVNLCMNSVALQKGRKGIDHFKLFGY